MRLAAIGDLVAGAGGQHELAPVGELGMQLAFQAQQDVSLGAPVIRQIAGRVLHHSYADISELPGAPPGDAGVALVFGALDFRPVWQAFHQ